METKIYEDVNNLFYWIRYGDLTTLKKKITAIIRFGCIEEDNLIDKRDALGVNIIHQAYFLENYKIGRWLVQKYPHIALRAHDGVLKDHFQFISKQYIYCILYDNTI